MNDGDEPDNSRQKSPAAAVVTSTDAKSHSGNLYWHLRWTIPLHIALPIGLWWMMQLDGWLAAQAFITLHVVGLMFFVGTIKWWWRQSGDLIGLLFINHFVTFAVCLFLPW